MKMKKFSIGLILFLFPLLIACGSKTEIVLPEELEIPIASEEVFVQPSEIESESESEEPEAEVVDPRLGEAFHAYLDILQNDSTSILEYNWQLSGNTPKPIAIYDICGDEIPELIYLKCRNFNMDIDLFIDTYKDGNVITLFSYESIDNIAGGSSGYYLFQKSGEKAAGLYISYFGEGQDELFFDLKEEGDSLQSIERVKLSLLPEYYGEPNIYRINGVDTSENEVLSEMGNIQSDTNCILLYNEQVNDKTADFIHSKECIAMTYEEAIQYLNGKIEEFGMGEGPKESDGSVDFSIFNNIPTEYAFSSGAGAWGTEITIHSDGTFEGSFHDTDAGLGGNGFDGTTTYSDFSGKFSNLKKVNDYTYSMELESLNYDKSFGDEYIEDQQGFKMKYVFSDAYGIKGGKTFYLYTKGAPVDDLPSEFVDWIKMPMMLNEEKTLPRYGLYNSEEKCGFFSTN